MKVAASFFYLFVIDRVQKLVEEMYTIDKMTLTIYLTIF